MYFFAVLFLKTVGFEEGQFFSRNAWMRLWRIVNEENGKSNPYDSEKSFVRPTKTVVNLITRKTLTEN